MNSEWHLVIGYRVYLHVQRCKLETWPVTEWCLRFVNKYGWREVSVKYFGELGGAVNYFELFYMSMTMCQYYVHTIVPKPQSAIIIILTHTCPSQILNHMLLLP